LVSAERGILGRLERHAGARTSHPTADRALEAIRGQAAAHLSALDEVLGKRDAGAGAQPTEPASVRSNRDEADDDAAQLLAAVAGALGGAAAAYATLLQLGLRLCEPEVRELASRHLSAYAHAIRVVSGVLPRTVVEDLNHQGLECRCVCPMCSIGICGCMAAGHHFVEEAWAQPATEPDGEAGFEITPPRTDSQLAAAGIKGGDRLVEIDGEPVTSFIEIQKAIRRHPIGEELSLRIDSGSGEVREVRARHVSDWPE
jgi:PDZ domain-containing protein